MAINKLRLLSGKPIPITDGITIQQPTVREFTDDNDDNSFYGIVWQLCSSAYDMPSVFADMGIDFMDVTDWMYFRLMCKTCPSEMAQRLFGVDFAKFQEMQRTLPDGEDDIVLYDEESEIIIDERVYEKLIAYMREIIGFSHTGRKPLNNATKKILILDDRRRRERASKKKEKDGEDDMIFDIIVSLVNTEEFGYTYESVYDLTLYQLLKSFTQIQGKKAAVALMQGSMSGFVDTKGIPSIDMQWTYSAEKYKPKQGKAFNKIQVKK